MSLTAEESLTSALTKLARTPRLLVCCDYDGTLAPIVEDPTRAHALPEAIAALRSLTSLPATDVAVISGRSLRDLAAFTRLPGEVHLVGSHGTEFDLDFDRGLPTADKRLLLRVRQEVTTQVAGVAGVRLEVKPASVAVHVRRTTPPDGLALVERLKNGVGTWRGVHIKEGKKVIELSVVPGDKGLAMRRLQHDLAASATVFIGDDIGDEAAFALLRGGDVSIKVGRGPSVAKHRIGTPMQVAVLLARLHQERRAWLTGGHAEPIEEHSLISDGATMGLISPAGDVCWLSCPEEDGSATFAAILGDDAAGVFRVRPVHGRQVLSQSYLPRTMILRTRFAGLQVVDYLDHGRGPIAGRTVSRLFRVVSGSEPTEVHFAPRPDFGQATVRLERSSEGLLVFGGPEPMCLRSPGVSWDIREQGRHEHATATFTPGDREVVLELRLGTHDLTDADQTEREIRAMSQSESVAWARQLKLPGVAAESVVRSALSLRALTHPETGVPLAAATLGLPEWLGGVRNWDYRYVWIRDAALTVDALLDLGATTETDEYISWVGDLVAAAGNADQLRPMYTVHGQHVPVEAAVEELPGYAGSRPVRLGNAAHSQLQLDVYGALCYSIAHRAAVRGNATEAELSLLGSCVAAVSHHWHEPDHGIWEIRDVPRHHTHSKMMCWVAVDAAIRTFTLAGAVPDDWQLLADQIALEVRKLGWSEAQGAYVTAYDLAEADAAVLQPLVLGFPAEAGQLEATVRFVETQLRRGQFVYRYRYDDGLPGDEGAMHICAAWLIEAYVAIGWRDDAEDLLAGMLSCTGRTGLLSEQVDPSDGRGLGNHPQAFSHTGLIKAAIAVAKARETGS